MYPHHAYPLAIILTRYNSWDWFYSNYIQLYSFYKNRFGRRKLLELYPNFLDYRRSMLLEVFLLNEDILDIDKNNITDMIIDWMQKRYYVQLLLIETEIPGTNFHKLGFVKLHQIFFYGYDFTQKVYKMLNFNSSGNFSMIDVKFDDLVRAYFAETTKSSLRPCYHWDDGGNPGERNIRLFKILKNLDYELDIRVIKNEFVDYLYANRCGNRDILHPDMLEGKCGIDVYDELITYLHGQKTSGEKIDIIPFHGLWEHKKIMLDRFKYLKQKEYFITPTLLNDVDLIRKKANNVRLLSLKYNLNSDVSYLERMNSILCEIRDLEKTVFDLFLKDFNI